MRVRGGDRDAATVAREVIDAASARDGAGVCDHASDTLLKLISDDPEIPVTAAECAEFVSGNIDSYGDPPAPGTYDIPEIGFQPLSDGVTETGKSAYVTIRPTARPDATASVQLQLEEDGVWRLWQCCDFAPEGS